MKINVRFLDFWTHFDAEVFLPMIALREVCKLKGVQLQIVESGASYSTSDTEVDIVIFSVFGQSHWDVPYDTVKIFYTGENICPDFNACDYALGFEHLDFADRYMRMPNYIATSHFRDITLQMEQLDRSVLATDMSKRNFCAFVVSNGNANSVRRDFFEALSVYREVDSGGRYLNNVGGAVKDKIDFCSQHKFTIAFENSSHSGYTTEKIVDAFAACSVPIYWGDPEIARVFNPKAFIDVTHCKTIDEMVHEVQVIDNDDDAYMQMLREEPYSDKNCNFDARYAEIYSFIENIVTNIENGNAQRYNREFWGDRYCNERKSVFSKREDGWLKKILCKINGCIKK